MSTYTLRKELDTIEERETFSNVEDAILFDSTLMRLISKCFINDDYKIRKVGSYQIKGCNPQDYDLLVYADKDFIQDQSMLMSLDGSDVGADDFVSCSVYVKTKEGEPSRVNIIMTADKNMFDGFIQAQLICQEYRITNKDDRIKIFDYIMEKGEDRITHEEFIKYLD